MQTTLSTANSPRIPPTDHRAGKYLAFHVGPEQFAITVLAVREIMGMQEITAVPQAPPYVRGVINLRGKVIPVVDLRLKMGIAAAEYTSRTCIIVVGIPGETNEVLTGAIVDAVSEVANIPGDEIEDAPGFGDGVTIPYLVGIAKTKEESSFCLTSNGCFRHPRSPTWPSTGHRLRSGVEVPSLTAPAGAEAPATLESLLHQYSANPAEAWQKASAQDDEEPDPLVLQVMLADRDCCGYLCDDRILSLPGAIAITRRLQKAAEHFEMRLARQAVSWAARPEEAPKAVRALLILTEVVNDNRINPIIVQLTRCNNATVRSRVRGMIARCCPNPSNVERYLDDEDPRVTANVLEMVAQSASNRAWLREILDKYIAHKNNRVAANAAVGLFRIGEETRAAELIQNMAADERPSFRSSAAWAIGQIALPALVDALHQLRQDSSHAVRWNALRSLVRLQKRAKSDAAPEPRP